MRVESPAFKEEETIPKRYSCEGENISPELHIFDIPEGTQSLCLIMEDPDAPGGIFVHWIAWNIQPDKTLDEGIKLDKQGINDMGKPGYFGPCPPPGTPHRYYFRVFALDSRLELMEKTTKEDLEAVMQGHILEEATLMGLYSR